MHTDNLIQTFQVLKKESIDKICAINGLLIMVN